MEENRDNTMTFSVRQLALLFGRSEQTIRRWKDQGKLTAGLGGDREDEPSGGALVFTIDAVREFVRKNPRVMDKARPEVVVELLGEIAGAALCLPPSVYADLGKRAAGTMALPDNGETQSEDSATERGSGPEEPFGRRPFRGSFDDQNPEDNGGDEDEGERASGASFHDWHDYLQELLRRREREVEEEREKLEQELERIERELDDLEQNGGSPYLRQLLRSRESEVRRREMELMREKSDLVRERFFREEPGPYLRQLLLNREENVHRLMDDLRKELDVIRTKKLELGLVDE